MSGVRHPWCQRVFGAVENEGGRKKRGVCTYVYIHDTYVDKYVGRVAPNEMKWNVGTYIW